MMHSIEIQDLSHQFQSDSKVLNRLNLNVPRGSIYGFLGKNGAGKTTTLKLLLGLLKSQSGRILIFGKSMQDHRIEILKGVGSLIESPSFYGHMTAKQNLSLLQKMHACNNQRINDVLTLVGLSAAGNKRVNQFSLGMKQRLAIGMALLHEPDLLILDEPTNGLDPKGIIEIRELLYKLNKERGVTILISSHLLSEVEKIVTNMAIIHEGKLLFQGTTEELRAKSNYTVILETDQPTMVSKLAAQQDMRCRTEFMTSHISNLTKGSIPDIINALVSKGVKIYTVKEQNVSLESLFIELIQD